MASAADGNSASWLSVTGRINADVFQYNYQDRIAYNSRSQSMYQEYGQKYGEFNYELLATANYSWNDHSLLANLGTNFLQRSRRVSDISTSGGLIIPNYYSLSNATSTVIPLSACAAVKWKISFR